MLALTRILVPTNLGEPSQTAIKYGVAFARQFGAKLFLLHALPAKEFDAAIETERVLEVLEPELQLGAHARRCRAQCGAAGVSRLLQPHEEQDSARNICCARHTATRTRRSSRAPRSSKVELIIMGKHRLGFVEHLLAGSVAEKVPRHAPCPVLIVQHPEHEFVLADAPQQTARALTASR